MSIQPNAKFVAKIKHVTEVMLVTTADLAYWRDHLQHMGLFPYNYNDQAELILSATALPWLGRQTNEFTISIAISHEASGTTRDGIYLIHAFHSSPMFAWIERTFFRTPYVVAEIVATAEPQPIMQVGSAQHSLIQARIHELPAASPSQFERWIGRIYVPRRSSEQSNHFFVAELSGDTIVYPFTPATSTLKLEPNRAEPWGQWLLESNLVATEWRIRHDAFHARSRTFEQQASMAHLSHT